MTDHCSEPFTSVGKAMVTKTHFQERKKKGTKSTSFLQQINFDILFHLATLF